VLSRPYSANGKAHTWLVGPPPPPFRLPSIPFLQYQFKYFRRGQSARCVWRQFPLNSAQSHPVAIGIFLYLPARIRPCSRELTPHILQLLRVPLSHHPRPPMIVTHLQTRTRNTAGGATRKVHCAFFCVPPRLGTTWGMDRSGVQSSMNSFSLPLRHVLTHTLHKIMW